MPAGFARVTVAGAALATALGAAERAWWPLGIPASFRPQLAAVLGVGSAALAASGAPAPALVGAAGLLVNLARVAPLYAGRRPVPATGARLRVAHWNLQHSNTRYDIAARVLRHLDADVVFLFEAVPPWHERLRQAGLPFVIADPPGVDRTLVLTREPLPVRELPLPAGRRVAEVPVEVGGRTVRVLGVHTLAPLSAARSRGRDAQLVALAALARACPDPLVALGDYNTVPWSRAYRDLLRDGGLVDSQRGFGPQPSWPAYDWAWWLRIPIDHALHSPDLVTVARAVGPAAASDHRLLQVTLAPTWVA